MIDIVERLRAHKVGVRWKRGIDTDYPVEWEPHPLCSEAADEIERLRHNERVMMDALYKACGDDEEMVRQTIESQGHLHPCLPTKETPK